MPSILIVLRNEMFIERSIPELVSYEMYLILLYLITLAGIALFFLLKLQHPNFWVLPLGLFFSWIYPIVSEYRRRLANPPDPDWDILPYVWPIVIFFLYSIPFTILSIIIFYYLRKRKNRSSE